MKEMLSRRRVERVVEWRGLQQLLPLSGCLYSEQMNLSILNVIIEFNLGLCELLSFIFEGFSGL
jgi:hypothetical protein